MSSSHPYLSLHVHTLPHLGVSKLRVYIYFTLLFRIICLQYTHACLEWFVVPVKLVDHFIIINFVVSINH